MAKYDPAEVMRRILDAERSDLRTALPGKVEKFYPTEQVADIQIMIKNVIKDDDGTEIEESFPVLPKVPIVYPSSGRFFVAFPLVKGDFVQVVFNEKSIDHFFEKGKEVHPLDLEDHALNGAVCFPGLVTKNTPISEDISANMVIGDDGGVLITIKPNGTIELGASGASLQPVALADDVKAEFDLVKSDLDTLKGILTTHTHTGVTSGMGSSAGSPSFSSYTPHTPGTVGSSKAKVAE